MAWLGCSINAAGLVRLEPRAGELRPTPSLARSLGSSARRTPQAEDGDRQGASRPLQDQGSRLAGSRDFLGPTISGVSEPAKPVEQYGRCADASDSTAVRPLHQRPSRSAAA